MSVEPFTFGIPLVARAASADWRLVEALLALTLTSLAGQGDRAFRIIVAGHDRPEIDGGVPYDFLRADWPVEPVRADNLDRGRKTQAINEAVLAAGGGLLMFVDADDWVDTRLVAVARETIAPEQVGGIVATGHAIDPRALRALAVPSAGIFEAGFDRLCGSSVVARLDPAAPSPLRRDPYAVLHEHYRFEDLCRANDLGCARLDVGGGYVVNTRANHSEHHGPFAEWRRSFSRYIAANGVDADDRFLAAFGLSRDEIISRLAPRKDARVVLHPR